MTDHTDTRANDALRSVRDSIAAGAAKLRAHIAEAVDEATDTADAAGAAARAGTRHAESYARGKPLNALAIAGAAGFVLALLLRRSR